MKISTITGQVHAKRDNWSAQSVHFDKKIHYYESPLYLYLDELTNTIATEQAWF